MKRTGIMTNKVYVVYSEVEPKWFETILAYVLDSDLDGKKVFSLGNFDLKMYYGLSGFDGPVKNVRTASYKRVAGAGELFVAESSYDLWNIFLKMFDKDGLVVAEWNKLSGKVRISYAGLVEKEILIQVSDIKDFLEMVRDWRYTYYTASDAVKVHQCKDLKESSTYIEISMKGILKGGWEEVSVCDQCGKELDVRMLFEEENSTDFFCEEIEFEGMRNFYGGISIIRDPKGYFMKLRDDNAGSHYMSISEETYKLLKKDYEKSQEDMSSELKSGNWL